MADRDLSEMLARMTQDQGQSARLPGRERPDRRRRPSWPPAARDGSAASQRAQRGRQRRRQRGGPGGSDGGRTRRTRPRAPCSCTTGPTTSTRTTSRSSRPATASTAFTYDTYASNEELLTKLQGGATGLYDIVVADRRVRARSWPTRGSSSELDFSRLPNAAYINPTFQNFYDPAGPQAKYNKYHLPKDWGTTGISLRSKIVTEDVKTWKDFFEVAPKYSGKIVVVNSAG